METKRLRGAFDDLIEATAPAKVECERIEDTTDAAPAPSEAKEGQASERAKGDESAGPDVTYVLGRGEVRLPAETTATAPTSGHGAGQAGPEGAFEPMATALNESHRTGGDASKADASPLGREGDEPSSHNGGSRDGVGGRRERKHLRDRVRRQAAALARARRRVDDLRAEAVTLRREITDGAANLERLRRELEETRSDAAKKERERARLAQELRDREAAEEERLAQERGLGGHARTMLPMPINSKTGRPVSFGDRIGVMAPGGYRLIECYKVSYDRSGLVTISDPSGVGGPYGSWREA